MQRSRRSRSASSTSSSSSSSSSSSTCSSSSGDERAAATPRFPPVPAPAFPEKVRDVIHVAKKKHRSDISADSWGREGFAGSDVCELPIDEANAIKREHCSELSVQRFIDEYERPYLPVVIDGIPEAESWSALQNWSLKKLRKNYKRVMLKCGEDDDGKSVRVKFKYFMKYLKLQTDDSPLYIFDSTFDDHKDTKPLLADYKVPKYFPEDLFELVGEDRRPPYRWFLVGPKRSGTTLHLDPLGSSAWNTLIVGRKRWVLFPPHVPKSVVNGKKHVQRGEDDEAVNYFMDLLPRVKRANSPEALGCIEFMQYPGETVFVPGGWWHAVLNVEDTVAVTQNFCSSQNFPGVWRKTRTGRKKMAVKWLHKLDGVRPDLGKVARELNAKDQFVMPPSDKQEKQDKHSERKDDNKKKKTSEGKHKRKKDESAEPSATKKKAKRN